MIDCVKEKFSNTATAPHRNKEKVLHLGRFDELQSYLREDHGLLLTDKTWLQRLVGHAVGTGSHQSRLTSHFEGN